jgi:hypothetical protein
MKILAIEKEVAGVIPEQFKLHFRNEALKVWEYYKDGIIREIYFTKTGHNAVIMLECKDENEANTLLAELPLVKEGLISFTILPLVAYNGFERLFDK